MFLKDIDNRIWGWWEMQGTVRMFTTAKNKIVLFST